MEIVAVFWQAGPFCVRWGWQQLGLGGQEQDKAPASRSSWGRQPEKHEHGRRLLKPPSLAAPCPRFPPHSRPCDFLGAKTDVAPSSLPANCFNASRGARPASLPPVAHHLFTGLKPPSSTPLAVTLWGADAGRLAGHGEG